VCTGSGFAASCVWHRVGSITDTIVDTDGEVRATASSYDLETPDHGSIVLDHCAPDGTPHPIWTPGVDRSERGNTTYTRRHDVSGRTPNTCVTHPSVCCPRYRECRNRRRRAGTSRTSPTPSPAACLPSQRGTRERAPSP